MKETSYVKRYLDWTFRPCDVLERLVCALITNVKSYGQEQ